MRTKSRLPIRFCFGWYHYQTEGKLQNLLEALEVVEARTVALALTEPALDGWVLETDVLSYRLDRLEKVIRICTRQGIHVAFIGPGLGDFSVSDRSYRQYVQRVYDRVGPLVRQIWVDDSAITKPRTESRRELLNWFSSIGRGIQKRNSKTRVGLIAAHPQRYSCSGLTAAELARSLARDEKQKPLLAQSQSFTQDYDRTGILDVIHELSLGSALYGFEKDLQFCGYLQCPSGSGFHKSAEATHIQSALNFLAGTKEILIRCFDPAGTAPGSEHIYLQAPLNRKEQLQYLSQSSSFPSGALGIRLVTAGAKAIRAGYSPQSDSSSLSCWSRLLHRMGLPVTVTTAESIHPSDSQNDVFVLTGMIPRLLSRRQLNHIFSHGVMLDAAAAETLQNMKLPGLIGVKVKQSPRDLVVEMFSDQRLAVRAYGHQLPLKSVPADQIRTFEPLHCQAQPASVFIRKKQSATSNGIILFDNVEHHHRCAIFPYSLSDEVLPLFLSPYRQLHFQDLFAWLLRRRLNGVVENTPDLVPLLLPGKKAKWILALLNVGFDWAIDARVRFGTMPFAVRKVQDLSEQNGLVCYKDLKWRRHQGYSFIQLTPDISVPPLQMTILTLQE